MRLKVGDVIYCFNSIEGLTYGKAYLVTNTREPDRLNGDDICLHVNGGSWWFGQIGATECWTNWFMTEKEWIRDIKLKELGI